MASYISQHCCPRRGKHRAVPVAATRDLAHCLCPEHALRHAREVKEALRHEREVIGALRHEREVGGALRHEREVRVALRQVGGALRHESEVNPRLLATTLETTQGKIDGFFSQLPCEYYLPEVASVGD